MEMHSLCNIARSHPTNQSKSKALWIILPNPMLKSKVFRAALFTECPTHIQPNCTSKDLCRYKPSHQLTSMLHDPSLIPYVEDMKISVPAVQFCQHAVPSVSILNTQMLCFKQEHTCTALHIMKCLLALKVHF